MKSIKITTATVHDEIDFEERMNKACWNYIKTIVEIVREPILLLDKDFNVMKANEPFFRLFQVDKTDTEGTNVYKLGNGQWDIPALHKLLENILPKNAFFKDFEVVHEFPFIGHKSMILNARQIQANDSDKPDLPPIIILAIEDVTSLAAIAQTLALHVKELVAKNEERTHELELYIARLEKKMKPGNKPRFNS